jgi:hypothetical protein
MPLVSGWRTRLRFTLAGSNCVPEASNEQLLFARGFVVRMRYPPASSSGVESRYCRARAWSKLSPDLVPHISALSPNVTGSSITRVVPLVPGRSPDRYPTGSVIVQTYDSSKTLQFAFIR